MRGWLVVIGMCVMQWAVAQDVSVPLDLYQSWKWERARADSGLALHAALKPYSDWGYYEPFMLRKSRAGEDSVLGKTSYLRFYPVVQGVGFGASNGADALGYESYGGAGLAYRVHETVFISAQAISGVAKPAAYIRGVVDSLRIFPGYGRAYQQDTGVYSFHQATFKLAWRPNEVVEFSAGRGKHFIGEGYRSVFLSDYAPNMNYVRTDVNVWRLKYMVLYAQMQHALGYPNTLRPTLNKYSTMHYLSFNITKWWNVGAFEAVVWESEDSVQNRNVDINYLNPIIFFRPLEYSIGSSDNILLGFFSSIHPARGLTMYSQVIFDELVVSELRSKVVNRLNPDTVLPTGWVGNKYAFQLGTKYHEPFGWKNATVLAEFNFVRPYVYAHGNTSQSYTHLNHPLAHPLGSNFLEWVAMAMWQPDRWNFALRSTYARKGYSNNLGNLGENPMAGLPDHNTNNRTYGNFTTQGRRVDVGNVRLEVGYDLVPNGSMRLEAALHLRAERTHTYSQKTLFFLVGLKTALWNDYRDI